VRAPGGAAESAPPRRAGTGRGSPDGDTELVIDVAELVWEPIAE
jgi:hypothetical protein